MNVCRSYDGYRTCFRFIDQGVGFQNIIVGYRLHFRFKIRPFLVDIIFADLAGKRACAVDNGAIVVVIANPSVHVIIQGVGC